jgi:multidrug resistance efflux pump
MALSARLINLCSSGQPVHSFNRQFVRLLLDATEAQACTAWLVRQNELILSEEIEQSPGAIRGIQVPVQDQQKALRGAYEESRIVVLPDRPGGLEPPVSAGQGESRSIAFVPLSGQKGNLGAVRLIFPPLLDAVLQMHVRLVEALGGYYALYAAERALQVQQQQREDIDKLNKTILQLHHHIFSRQLPEVIVNSAVEIARTDRAVLLVADKSGELSLTAVSSVSEVNRKGAWARLICELGEIVLSKGQPLQFFSGQTDVELIEDEEQRQKLHSYLLMTEAKSLLLFPLESGDEKAGVLVFEGFSEQLLSPFERVLCTVFAAHAASAVINFQAYLRLPLSRFFGKKAAIETKETRGHTSKLGKRLQVGGLLLLLTAAGWLLFALPVKEKIGAQCFVEPFGTRVITAKISGEIQQVHFRQGDYVRPSDVLITLRTDEISLMLSQELENARTIEAQIVKLRGAAENENAQDRKGALLAELQVQGHSLAAKQEEVKLLHARLEDCYLRSPIEGTVLEPEEPQRLLGVVVREGEPLCRVGSVSEKVRVKVAVPAENVSQVQNGREVEIRLRPLITQELLRGRIESIAERSVTYLNSNVYMADVIVDNHPLPGSDSNSPLFLLKPGMTGKAKVVLPGKSSLAGVYGGRLWRKLKYWLF